jgi:hypothetical protein
LRTISIESGSTRPKAAKPRPSGLRGALPNGAAPASSDLDSSPMTINLRATPSKELRSTAKRRPARQANSVHSHRRGRTVWCTPGHREHPVHMREAGVIRALHFDRIVHWRPTRTQQTRRQSEIPAPWIPTSSTRGDFGQAGWAPIVGACRPLSRAGSGANTPGSDP